jgi:hypothetical protein
MQQRTPEGWAIRVDRDLREGVAQLAAAEFRTPTDMVRTILRRELIERGLLPKPTINGATSSNALSAPGVAK